MFVTCHECGYIDSKVIESRDLEEGASIRRRRQCLGCGFRFTTYERVEMPSLVVVKKDGRREPFDRQKISAGLYRACEKRPVSVVDIGNAIVAIERELYRAGEHEVPASRVGELVMEKLATMDDVAYVRFASVYRQFTDIASFESEVRRMRGLATK
jgi:transcriptional repressor NrdR